MYSWCLVASTASTALQPPAGGLQRPPALAGTGRARMVAAPSNNRHLPQSRWQNGAPRPPGAGLCAVFVIFLLQLLRMHFSPFLAVRLATITCHNALHLCGPPLSCRRPAHPPDAHLFT